MRAIGRASDELRQAAKPSGRHTLGAIYLKVVAMEIKAFVARSFVKEDAAVVAEFMNYFKQYEPSGLRCFDAEAGAIGEIDDKVRAKLNEAQAFICVLTRRHCSIQGSPPLRASPPLLNRMKSLFTSSVAWAGPAWTLQESGYATARELPMIYIVERGIDDYGGLHGNPVIVWFERDRINACFVELAGQITTLIQHFVGGARSTEVVTRTGDAEGGTAEVAALEKPKRSLPELYEHELEMQLAFGSSPPDLDKAERAYEHAAASAKTERDKDWLRVEYLGGRLTAQAYSAFEALETYAREESSMFGYVQLGRYLSSIGEHGRALSVFETARGAAPHGLDESVPVIEAAACLTKLGRAPEAQSLLLAAYKTEAPYTYSAGRYCTSLADAATASGDWRKATVWLESAVSHQPTDKAIRFRLARLYAENGEQGLAALHYETLVENGGDGGSANNLGVAYSELGLGAHSIEAYDRAAGMGESLALANKARKLMGAGFLALAGDMIAEAEKLPERHDEVTAAKARIVELRREENERKESMDRETADVRQFYVGFGDALKMTSVERGGFGGAWVTEWGEVPIVESGPTLSGVKSERGSPKEFGESGVRIILAGVGKSSVQLRRTVRLLGTIDGGTASGVLTQTLHIEGEAEAIRSESIQFTCYREAGVLHWLETMDGKPPRRLVRRVPVHPTIT